MHERKRECERSEQVGSKEARVAFRRRTEESDGEELGTRNRQWSEKRLGSLLAEHTGHHGRPANQGQKSKSRRCDR